MKETLKLVATTIISIITLMTLTSCSLENQFSEEDVIKYLEDKYGTEFTYMRTVGDGDLTTKKNVSSFARQPDHKGREVFVVTSLDGNKVVHRDNYVAIKYEDKTVELINSCTKKVFDKYKIIYVPVTGQTFEEKFNNDMSFEDYIKDSGNLLRFDVIIPNDCDWTYGDREVSKLKSALDSERVHCCVNVYKAKTGEIYDKIQDYSDCYDKDASFDEQAYFEVGDKKGKEESVTENTTEETSTEEPSIEEPSTEEVST